MDEHNGALLNKDVDTLVSGVRVRLMVSWLSVLTQHG